MGLRTKILLTIIGPLAVLLTIFTLLDLRSSRNEAIGAASTALGEQVRLAAGQLDGLLLRMSQIAETAAIAIRDGSVWPESELRQLGTQLVESDQDVFGFAFTRDPECKSFEVIYREGDRVVVKEGADLQDSKNPICLRLQEEKASFWAAPHEGTLLSGQDAAAHLVPIMNKGKLGGGVAVILDPTSFRRLADRVGLDNTSWLIMADDGIVVASSESTARRLAEHKSIRGRNLFELLAQRGVGAAEIEKLQENIEDRDIFVQISTEGNAGNAPQVAAIARLKGTTWFLITGEPIEKIIGPVDDLVVGRTILDLILIFTAVVIVQIGAWFTILRPLRKIVGVVELASRGQRQARVDLPGKDEIAVLGRAVDQAIPRLDELATTRAAMENARLIQDSLIPVTPCFGLGVVVAGRVEPCDETGGDYFDHSSFPDGRTFFTLGDATGHGLPAAILVATARAYVRSAVRRDESMAETVKEANERLFEDSPPGLFMVMVHACFDGRTGDLEIVSAGQPAWVLRRGEDAYTTIKASGIPLGIASTTFESRRIEGLQTGDVVLLASDGAWEVRNDRNEMLGIEALLERAREIADLDPTEQVERLFEFVHEFAGERPLDDDCSIVIARIQDR